MNGEQHSVIHFSTLDLTMNVKNHLTIHGFDHLLKHHDVKHCLMDRFAQKLEQVSCDKMIEDDLTIFVVNRSGFRICSVYDSGMIC